MRAPAPTKIKGKELTARDQVPQNKSSFQKEEPMEQYKIDRINALARKAKTPEGLTEEEKHERALLRREYLDAVKANLESQLEHTYLQRPDGTRVPMKKRKD